MHLDDVVERLDRFENEKVVFSHFSTRYHGRQIERMVSRAIPDLLDGRIELWV
jgi:ribonuclease Z